MKRLMVTRKITNTKWKVEKMHMWLNTEEGVGENLLKWIVAWKLMSI